MDFVLDYVSVTTFWTIFFTVHALLAVALLGALTHQAVSVLAPARQAAGGGGFGTRFRGVHGAAYTGAVCVLWILTLAFGGWIYTKYRIYVRIPMEQEGFWKTLGMFELKEQLATIGLCMLPAYWFFWKNVKDPKYDSARRCTTVMLAGIAWFMFLVGQVVNNVRGFGS